MASAIVFTLPQSLYVDACVTGQTGLRGSAPNPAPPPANNIALDGVVVGRLNNIANGNNQNFFHGAQVPVYLNTTLTNDIVIVTVASNTLPGTAPTVSSITSSSGLTFTRVGGVAFQDTNVRNPNPPQQDLEMFWAKSTAVLTNELITINMTSAISSLCWCGFAVNGLSLTTPIDPNGSAVATNSTVTSTGPTVTITSTHAIDILVYAGCGEGVNVQASAPTSFTSVVNALIDPWSSVNMCLSVSAQIVSSAGSSGALVPSIAGNRNSGSSMAAAFQGA